MRGVLVVKSGADHRGRPGLPTRWGRPSFLASVFGLSLALGGGCGDPPVLEPPTPATVAEPSDPSWKPVAVDELAGPALASWQRALAARDQLAGRLLNRVREAMVEGGPAGAIAVCQTEAPAIARAVADKTGVQIGRTALKLRNPANAPPSWAKALLASATPEAPWVVVNESGTTRGLLPIRLQAACLTCHGPSETLTEEVRSALARGYPGDQAVGFAEGDLRGWFWVEATPPPPSESSPTDGGEPAASGE